MECNSPSTPQSHTIQRDPPPAPRKRAGQVTRMECGSKHDGVARQLDFILHREPPCCQQQVTNNTCPKNE